MREESSELKMVAVRPLVRYVDEQIGVIELRMRLRGPIRGPLAMELTLHSLDGQEASEAPEHIVRRAPLRVHGTRARARVEIPRPHRWWPAGMGEQPLYGLRLRLLQEEEPVATWDTTLGLTSVRRPPQEPDEPGLLLINGQLRRIETLVPVEPEHEAQLLPASSDALLLVRSHYGSDALYDAADRAGVMLMQEIPPGQPPDPRAPSEIDRLAAHPSLAGWVLEAESAGQHTLQRRVHHLDPTRLVLTTADLRGTRS